VHSRSVSKFTGKTFHHRNGVKAVYLYYWPMPTISQGHNIKYLIKTLNILQSLKFVTALLSLLLKKTCSIDDFYNYNILFIDHPLTLMGIFFYYNAI